MYLPPVDDLAVLDDVEVRMLSGGEAGMVCENLEPIAYLQAIERLTVAGVYLAVLLR